MRPAALLFDLDGTLVDSHREICLSIERAFLDVDLDLGLERVFELVNGSALESIWEAAGHVDVTRFSAFATAYRTHYLADLGKTCALFPGVQLTLEALRERYPEVPFGVVSNKSAPTVQPLLQTLGIEHFFELALGCGGTAMRPKPHPESLLLAAARLGREAPGCVMVGDTVFDVHAGVAAGMTTVAVTYGMGETEQLHASGAHHVLDEFEVLLTLFS